MVFETDFAFTTIFFDEINIYMPLALWFILAISIEVQYFITYVSTCNVLGMMSPVVYPEFQIDVNECSGTK